MPQSPRPLPSQAAPPSGPPPPSHSNGTAPIRPGAGGLPRRRASASPPHLDATTRKDRINEDMLSLLRRPPAADGADVPAFIRGIGLYTHGEVESPALFPHQRYAPPPPQIKFVPLGGLQRAGRKGDRKAEISTDVAKLYERLKRAMLEEEEEMRRSGCSDPKERFDALGPPDIMAPSMERGGASVAACKTTPSSTITSSAVKASGETTYDSSRDPRRRGR